MTAFDLTPLVAPYAGVVTDGVHLLRITAEWFCGSEDCGGHEAPAEGGECELSYELVHPDVCPVPACCCTWPEGPSAIDPNCEGGMHDACLNLERCWTSRELSEWGLDFMDLPKVTADYRIQAWGDGPDHEGEYDGGIEVQAIGGAS